MAGNHVLKVSLITDDSKFKKGMQGAEKSTSLLSGAFKVLGAVSVASLARKALTAVKDFAGDSIRAFSDLNESTNAVNVTFGKNAEGIKKLGEQAARSVGLSNSQFNSYAVSISAFADQIAGESGDVVGTVDTLTKRVADFASVMNLDIGEAFGKFQSGLAGQSRPLREFGIDVSDAAVKAFALANGIGNANGELTEAEKVQARYGVIMQQTAKTQGDFANTSHEMANKERILNAELENSKALLGQSLAPAKNLFLGLQSWGVKALTDLAVQFGRMTGEMNSADVAINSVQASINRGMPLYEALGNAINEAVQEDENFWRSFLRSADALGLWSENWVVADDAIQQAIPGLVEAAGGIDELRAQLDRGAKALGVSEERLQETKDALDDYEDAAREAAGEQARFASIVERTSGPVEDLADAQEELAEETKTATQALKDQNAELRGAVDPVFNLWRKLNELEEAQRDYSEAVREFGPDSQEAIEAGEKLMGVYLDVDAAAGEVVAGGPELIESFRNTATEANLAGETVDNVLGSALGRIPKEVSTRINVHYTPKAPPQPAPGFGGVFHDGGVVPGPTGAEVPILAKAGETVLPTHKPGFGVGGGNNYNITVNALDPQSAADAVVQALQEYERTNGAVPINVRVG